MAEVHAEIAPFKAYVHEMYLYDMDPSKKGLIKCEVFGVSSYPGHMLTFTIFIPSTGATFCYIPIHALHATKAIDESAVAMMLSPHELQVGNCLEKDISVICYEYLRPLRVVGFFKNKEFKIDGSYLFSIDWYKQNDLWHIVKLVTGQFCALPNYRLLFNPQGQVKLPDYKVLHSEWIR